MTRSLLVAALMFCVVVMGACVNLDRPEPVVKCAQNGTCRDQRDAPSWGEVPGSGRDVEGNLDRFVGPGPDALPVDVPDGAAGSLPEGGSEPETARPGLDGPGGTSSDSVDVPGPADAASDPPFVDSPDDAPDSAPDLAEDVAPDLGKDVAPDAPSGVCWTGGSPLPAGTVCRPAAGPCDAAEVCDGSSADCPPDAYAAAAKVCRPAAGDCDVAESCTGTSPGCPADVFSSAGVVCRGAAGVCDLAESCSGISPDCPVDRRASAATVCRVSTDGNRCDPVETCTGSGSTCPADVFYARPAAPGGVMAVAGTLQATISWNEVAGATGYNVKRSAVSGSGYMIEGNAPTDTASPYLSTGLVGGTPYYWVVSSVNTLVSCESANSAQVSATPIGLCVPPPAPSVTATPANAQVTLTWTASSGATSYGVARSTTSGTGYTSVATVTTGLTYNDVDVVNGTTYHYVVTASNGTCSSAPSLEASATPNCVPPAVPTGVTATPDNSNGRITVAWGTVPNATGYTVSRSTNPDGPYAALSTNQTAATYTDSTGLTAGTVYYYVVSASNTGGTCSSADSSPGVSARSCIVPSVPSGVAATAGISRVTVSWTASTGGPTSYEVKRGSAAGGPFASIGTPGASPHVDSDVTNGTTYYYVVAARNAGGACSSANSGAVSATPRSCTVISGCGNPCAVQSFGTTAGRCFVTCGTISGWACWNSAGRTFTINGRQMSGCGATPVAAPKIGNYNVIDVSAGTNAAAGLNWWDMKNNTCSIPAGGLDF